MGIDDKKEYDINVLEKAVDMIIVVKTVAGMVKIDIYCDGNMEVRETINCLESRSIHLLYQKVLKLLWRLRMSNREAVRKLLALLKDYTKIISIIFGCLLISTVLNLCVPLLSRRIMDDGFIGGNKELLIKLVLCSLMVYLVISVIDIIKEKNRINISAKIQYSLSEQAFSHLMKMKASYFNNKNYAEILNNINVDIGNMTSIADEGVFLLLHKHSV